MSHTGPSVRRKRDVGGPAKLFVLDTNVLLHHPMSLFRFDEHDIYLPMITLEELDGHKKGMTQVARNARQVSRELDTLATDLSTRQQVDPAAGIELAKTGHIEAKGKLYFQTHRLWPWSCPSACPGQGRQPDPGRGPGAAPAAAMAARWCWCPRHQHAHQGPRTGPDRRRLFQRQDPGRRRPALHRRPGPGPRLLGAPRQGHGELGSKAAPPSHRITGPAVPTLMVNQSCTWKARA